MLVRRIYECSEHQSDDQHDVDLEPVNRHIEQRRSIHEHVDEYLHKHDVVDHVIDARTNASAGGPGNNRTTPRRILRRHPAGPVRHHHGQCNRVPQRHRRGSDAAGADRYERARSTDLGGALGH